MDEELRAYLDAMRLEIIETLGTQLAVLRGEFNDAQERILNRVTSLEQDFQNVRGFLLNDAAVSGRRWFDLEERVARLERDRKTDH